MAFSALGAFVFGCSGSASSPAISVGAADAATPPDAAAPATDAAGPADDAATILHAETWTDGKKLTGSVAISPGVTVTIAPGAAISCAPGVSIIVDGTLVGSSAQGPHATLAGEGWGGLVVGDYGMVTLDGVDIRGASVALDVSGELGGTFDHGTIDGAGTPFFIRPGAQFSTAHAIVTAPRGKSRVGGALTASYLDYDANDQHAIWAESPYAVVRIDDSTFHNSGPLGARSAPDVLNALGASIFHVAYTDISGAHCGFHFEAVDTIDIDHVTVHDVANGADLWGSSTKGARTIKSSNFEKLTENFDESGSNGAIDVSGCYTTGTNNLQPASVVQIASPATQAVPDARPRP